MKILFVLVLSFFVITSCKWVKPDEGAADVALMKAALTQNCTEVGFASASVKHKIGFIERKKGKVADELILLAKNEALKLGGNAIVMNTRAVEGQQSFKVYNCPF
ncbi:MAG: hypothetical protein ACI93R_003599 [Flavobacteriales bacterium]